MTSSKAGGNMKGSIRSLTRRGRVFNRSFMSFTRNIQKWFSNSLLSSCVHVIRRTCSTRKGRMDGRMNLELRLCMW